jgi:hypothetical protein
MEFILNIPKSIREDDINHPNNSEEDDDLIFGALDNEKSPSIDERDIHYPSENERTKKRERTSSSISTTDGEWENILPITESDGLLSSTNHLESINEKSSTEQIIGMSNFRAKHRLRRRSKSNTLVRWKDAVKKVVQLKDPW